VFIVTNSHSSMPQYANKKALRPSLVLAWTSAPRSMKYSTTAIRPDLTAEWRGVMPSRPGLLRTAPPPLSSIALMALNRLASNSRLHSPPPLVTKLLNMHWRVVYFWSGSCIVTSAPRSTSRITASKLDVIAAIMRGVASPYPPVKAPSSWLMSAPLLSASSMALVLFAHAARWRAGAQQIPAQQHPILRRREPCRRGKRQCWGEMRSLNLKGFARSMTSGYH
jgi:hypothetical protein